MGFKESERERKKRLKVEWKLNKMNTNTPHSRNGSIIKFIAFHFITHIKWDWKLQQQQQNPFYDMWSEVHKEVFISFPLYLPSSIPSCLSLQNVPNVKHTKINDIAFNFHLIYIMVSTWANVQIPNRYFLFKFKK